MLQRGGLFLTLLLLSTGSSGCQSILGIEQVGIVERDACTEGSCANVSCTDDADCGRGFQCRDGRCQSRDSAIPPGPEGGVLPDAGLDGGRPDGGADAGPDAGTCVEGALRCDSSTGTPRSVCRDGKWTAATPCKQGELCDPSLSPPGQCKPSPCSGECATCAVNEMMRCAGEASAEREVCQKGVYVPAEACSADSRCDRAAATPGDCSPMVEGCKGQAPGTPVCVGATRIVCGPDLVSTTGTPKNCKGPAYCEQGTGPSCAVCITEEHACEGSQLQVCNDAHTGFVSKGNPCPQDAPCNKDLKQCTKLFCMPGKWSCAGDTIRHCNADGTGYITSDEQACGAGLCNADGQRCNVCKPDLIRCPVEGDKGRVQCSIDGRRETAIASCPNACLGGNCVACRPNDTRCDPSTAQTSLRYRQVCSSMGTWNAGTDCSVSSETCLYSATTGQSACGGKCAAGTPRCSTQTKNPENCADNGAWLQVSVCTVPDQICRIEGSAASCKTNSPYDLGNKDASAANGWAAFQPSIGAGTTLYLVPVVPPQQSWVTGFKVTGRVAGGSCRMVLYGDSGGAPGARLAQGTSTIGVIAGTSGSASNVNPELNAGQTYWVGGECAASTGSVELLQKNMAGRALYMASHSYGSAFPATFPSVSSAIGIALSFFLEIQEVP